MLSSTIAQACSSSRATATQSSALNATAPRRCSRAAAGFLGGYFHNYHLPTAKVTGATYPDWQRRSPRSSRRESPVNAEIIQPYL